MYEATQRRILEYLEAVRDRDGRDGTFRIELRELKEENYNLLPIAVTAEGQEILGEPIPAELAEDLESFGGNLDYLIHPRLTELARKLPMKSS